MKQNKEHIAFMEMLRRSDSTIFKICLMFTDRDPEFLPLDDDTYNSLAEESHNGLIERLYELIDRLSPPDKALLLLYLDRVPAREMGRRWILSSLAMALVCLAAIVGMVILRQHYISDIFDQLFFAFLALLMVVALIQSLRQIFLLRRQPLLNSQFSILNFQFSILSLAAVFAAVVVMFLFLAIPVQNGRAISHGSPSHRSAALTSVSFVLSHIQ